VEEPTVSARCDLWDLPVESCACPQHRGGADTIAEPGTFTEDGPLFIARYPGRCARCRQDIEQGEVIASTGGDRYVHAGADRCLP
jgi:hypothetical protein